MKLHGHFHAAEQAPDGSFLRCLHRCVRRRERAASGGEGHATEIAVPLRALGAEPGDTLRLHAALDAENLYDTFTFAKPDNPENWIRIVLK